MASNSCSVHPVPRITAALLARNAASLTPCRATSAHTYIPELRGTPHASTRSISARSLAGICMISDGFSRTIAASRALGMPCPRSAERFCRSTSTLYLSSHVLVSHFISNLVDPRRSSHSRRRGRRLVWTPQVTAGGYSAKRRAVSARVRPRERTARNLGAMVASTSLRSSAG
uniref:Uncharacterized protein n=1 Tax=Arundo donax TaxID=35708 RepID=A0A0A9CYP7_ARUDO